MIKYLNYNLEQYLEEYTEEIASIILQEEGRALNEEDRIRYGGRQILKMLVNFAFEGKSPAYAAQFIYTLVNIKTKES